MLFADCLSFDERRQKIKAFYRTQDCVSNLLKRFTYAVREFSNKLLSKSNLSSSTTLYVHPNRRRHLRLSSALSKTENLIQENAEVKRHNVPAAITCRSDIA
jgi:hypothetical protein